MGTTIVYSRNILILFAITVLGSLAANLIVPVWPIYIRSLGASMTELGYIFSVSNAVAAALQVPSGFVSDRFGRRRLHAVGTLIGVFPPFFYALAANWFDLIPWVILTGVSTGLAVPLRWTMVADDTSAQTRATAFSWLNVAFLTGPTIGPVIGGLIADVYSVKTPFYLCFLVLCVNSPLSLWLKETRREGSSNTTPEATEEPMSSPYLTDLTLFSLINVIQGVATGIFTPVTPVFAVQRFSLDLGFVGLLWAVGFGLSSVIVQIPGARLADRFRKKRVMLLCFMASAPFFGLLSLSRNAVELLIYLFLANAVSGLSWPAFQALTMDLTPASRWGLVNGMSATTFWVGMALGSALGGLLWDTYGMSIPYYTTAFFMFLSVIPALFLREKYSK